MAVVGLGHLSLNQVLPGFGQAAHVRVTALVSGEADKARAVAAQYGVPETGIYDYAGFDRIRDNPGIDIVYIVLPNAMHAESTVRAAQAGKHVLCEKPIAASVADAQHMVEACHAANRKLMIAYRCQYEPHHRALIAALRSGDHGPIRSIETVNGQNNADNGQWRHNRSKVPRGGGHDVLHAPLPSGASPTAVAAISFHESRWLRVMARDAWLGLDPAFGYENIALEIGRRSGKGNGLERIQFAPHNQFAREMDHFAEALKAGGGTVKMAAMQGLDATRGPAPKEEG